MIRTQVYLPREQIDELRLLACSQQTTISGALRNLIKKNGINHVLVSPTKKKQPKSRNNWLLALAKEAEKRGFRGPSDLSTNMDKYLYG